jgi:predicted 3-demethylubiquinone-9 3-methyltransferase (glyoxalase superfamily)
MGKITPYLWFDGKAEEATDYYMSVFKEAKITNVMRYPEGGPAPAGTVLSVSFRIHDQEFIALNGGPQYKFTEAISFFIACDSQAEIDYLWERLSDGGTPQPCGWLKDRFGLSWQIVPPVLGTMLADKDSLRATRVMNALFKMQKIHIPTLQAAYDDRL